MLASLKRKVFTLFILLPGTMFLVNGLTWLVDPDLAAANVMMPLLDDGVGLSTQISNTGGLFLAMGLMILYALSSRNGQWLKSVALLLVCIAFYRSVAFLVHDADLLLQMIMIELVLAAWLYIASTRLAAKVRE